MHGSGARERYAVLVTQAIIYLRENPASALSTPVPNRPGFFTYHLRHSRMRSPGEMRVGKPRHIVVYAVADGTLEILRILHDRMDLRRRIASIRR